MFEPRASRWRTFGIPAILFLLSIVTTMAIGARFMQNFHDGLPMVAHDEDLWPWPWLIKHPSRFALGWPFAATLLFILLSHEFGHYVACRRHKVACTLPWVLPAPTLSGTLGAIIRLRGRIPDRRILMDIGVWGPIAGYVASLIVAVPGIILSTHRTLPHTHPLAGLVAFNPPLSLTLLPSSIAHLASAPAMHADVSMELATCHPVLLAAWIGLFITSLNLIPSGQLDGGHILYAVSPRLHRVVSRVLPLLLLVAAWYCWIGWAVWGLILLIPAMRHPRVPPDTHLDNGRWLLALLALIIFVLTITPTPFPGSALRDLVALSR
jgi:membrane-associated protease RseP (regulator of RpoE activity)